MNDLEEEEAEEDAWVDPEEDPSWDPQLAREVLALYGSRLQPHTAVHHLLTHKLDATTTTTVQCIEAQHISSTFSLMKIVLMTLFIYLYQKYKHGILFIYLFILFYHCVSCVSLVSLVCLLCL